MLFGRENFNQMINCTFLYKIAFDGLEEREQQRPQSSRIFNKEIKFKKANVISQTNNFFQNKSKMNNEIPTPCRANIEKLKNKENFNYRTISNNRFEKSTYNTSQGATIHSFRNQQQSTAQKVNFVNNTYNIFNNKISSDNEKNKIEDYKFMLNQELLEILLQERECEIKRENLLSNCKYLEEREKYSKIFAIERKLATQKILNFNE